MFWSSKDGEVKNVRLEPILFDPRPSSKEFKLMFELLKDAEKYFNGGEHKTSNAILQTLKSAIDDHIEKKNEQ